MAGLALGSKVIGNLSDRIRNPLLLLLVTEVLLGLFAWLFNSLFNLHIETFTSLVQTLQPAGSFIPVIKFIFAFILLIIPCSLIGGTIPLFIRIISPDLSLLGRRSGTIYSINNLGAALGCLATGFFILHRLGLTHSLYLGGTINIFNGVIAGLLILLLPEKTSWKRPDKIEAGLNSTTDQGALPGRRTRNILLAVFTLEGFTTLSYEVIWSRILNEFSYDKSVYLDALIIFTFIFGLAVGSVIIARIPEKKWNGPVIVGWLETGIAFFSILGLFLASRIIPEMIPRQLAAESWWQVSGVEYLVFFSLMIIPVVLMGITFPVVLKFCVNNPGKTGSKTGTVSMLDTLGSVAGAFVAGFLIIPALGTVRGFELLVLINLSMGVVLLWPLLVRGKYIYIFPGSVIAILLMLILIPHDGLFKTRIAKREGEKLLWYREGASGTVSVHSFGFGRRALAINGALFAYSTTDDIRSHKLLAYLPYMIHPDPDKVLVIGHGMGLTARSFLQNDISKVCIAEINPLVIEASLDYFSSFASPLQQTDKVNFIYDDGVSHLHMSNDKYDIVTCDAMHPRLGNNLFTLDFYELVKSNLNDQGILCMWMPFNWLSETEYKSALKAFTTAFDKVTLWYINRGVNLLVGTNGNYYPDYEHIRTFFDNPVIYSDLAEVDIFRPEMVLGRLRYGTRAIRDYTCGVPVNDDEYSLLEYSREPVQAPNRFILEWLREAGQEYMQYISNLPDTASNEYTYILYQHEMITQDIDHELSWMVYPPDNR